MVPDSQPREEIMRKIVAEVAREELGKMWLQKSVQEPRSRKERRISEGRSVRRPNQFWFLIQSIHLKRIG